MTKNKGAHADRDVQSPRKSIFFGFSVSSLRLAAVSKPMKSANPHRGRRRRSLRDSFSAGLKGARLLPPSPPLMITHSENPRTINAEMPAQGPAGRGLAMRTPRVTYCPGPRGSSRFPRTHQEMWMFARFRKEFGQRPGDDEDRPGRKGKDCAAVVGPAGDESGLGAGSAGSHTRRERRRH